MNRCKWVNMKNPIYIKPMNFVCPTCGENARVNLTEYKIFSQCKKGHSKGNILLHENKEQQKIDISKIICGDCKEVNKGSISPSVNKQKIVESSSASSLNLNLNENGLNKSLNKKLSPMIYYKFKNNISKVIVIKAQKNTKRKIYQISEIISPVLLL